VKKIGLIVSIVLFTLFQPVLQIQAVNGGYYTCANPDPLTCVIGGGPGCDPGYIPPCQMANGINDCCTVYFDQHEGKDCPIPPLHVIQCVPITGPTSTMAPTSTPPPFNGTITCPGGGIYCNDNPANPIVPCDPGFICNDVAFSGIPAGCNGKCITTTPIPTTGPASTGAPTTKTCDFIPEPTQKTKCNDCFSGNGSWTAIGCIPTDPSAFIGTILNFAIGIAGGIAFLLILLGGFQIMTSAGNPEQLNAGRELVTSAITGLILIIFSVFLLRVIGVDILGLPNFSK
jgi:hypothetical protein